jgi:hypothetical protein
MMILSSSQVISTLLNHLNIVDLVKDFVQDMFLTRGFQAVLFSIFVIRLIVFTCLSRTCVRVVDRVFVTTAYVFFAFAVYVFNQTNIDMTVASIVNRFMNE